jgi:peptidylprolyl isomerase
MKWIFALAALAVAHGAAAQTAPRDAATVLAEAPAADWRPLDPERTLYLDLPAGRVIIELDPAFAPLHAANLATLVRAHYFDGLWIERAQDNYVVQWGDPDAKRSLGAAKPALPPEFSRPITPADHFVPLPDPDSYAPHTGFADDFPVAWDTARGQAWLTHCYGMVGVGRDNGVTTGSGAELYAVIGNAPRNLDRNVTLIGRVVQGMELLSTMPRGTAAMGFYEKPEQRTPIRAVRFAADLPPGERVRLEVLRTDSRSFADWLAAKRTRTEAWFQDPVGHIEVCNAPVPVRPGK